MGGLNSKILRDGPVIGYAQTHSRSQVHEVAVIPLTIANFPDSSCPAFARLHEIYCTCPRVRQHFAHNMDVPLDCDAFYKQVVVDASHPNLPMNTSIPVAVATRWRGDEQWDIAGFVGCRGFSSHGELNDVNLLQMFFRDGHKVPLTMPAIQLAAKLFAEMHVAVHEEAGSKSVPPTPWPTNVEWTIRRHNMEVRRVLEAVLVFWGLRPARTSVNEPAYEFYRRLPPHLLAMLAKEATPDAAPYATFPLELRSVDDERITVGSRDRGAVASLMNDLAGWASGPSRWMQGCVPSAGLDTLLPPTFATRGRVLTTGLSMNFRGTQQKTPVERRDILGALVADHLELIQPIAKEGAEDVHTEVSTPVSRGSAPASQHLYGMPTAAMDPQQQLFAHHMAMHGQLPPQLYHQMQPHQGFFASPMYGNMPQQFMYAPMQQPSGFVSPQLTMPTLPQQLMYVNANGLLVGQPPAQQNVVYVMQHPTQPSAQATQHFVAVPTGSMDYPMWAAQQRATTASMPPAAKPASPLLSLPFQGSLSA